MRLALDYARSLDAMLLDADDDLHDALMAVGDLLGGLSCDGFHDDLIYALDAIETDHRAMDETWFANDWWLRARAIMARVPVQASQVQIAAMKEAA